MAIYMDLNAGKKRQKIVIASRQSRLAKIQAQAIGAMLQSAHPDLSVEFRWVESEGDKRLDIKLTPPHPLTHTPHTTPHTISPDNFNRPNSREIGKGLFAKAVEQLLIDGEADVAVHSLKDVPVAAVDGLTIVAIPPREDVRDVLIAPPAIKTIDDLPRGATIGTASPRRAAQLKMLRPDVTIGLLRGNVETRIRKIVAEHEYDATLLAAAGLRRLGLHPWLGRAISTDVILPAASQGALGVQCRTNDRPVRKWLTTIHDEPTARLIAAERQVIAGLNGDCHSPIAVLAEYEDAGRTVLRARVWAVGDVQIGQGLQADETGTADELPAMADRVVASLRGQGSDQIMGLPQGLSR